MTTYNEIGIHIMCKTQDIPSLKIATDLPHDLGKHEKSPCLDDPKEKENYRL